VKINKKSIDFFLLILKKPFLGGKTPEKALKN